MKKKTLRAHGTKGLDEVYFRLLMKQMIDESSLKELEKVFDMTTESPDSPQKKLFDEAQKDGVLFSVTFKQQNNDNQG